jgi:hypothetical protein
MTSTGAKLDARAFWVRLGESIDHPARLEWQLVSKPDLGGPGSLIIHFRSDIEAECHRHFYKLKNEGAK